MTSCALFVFFLFWAQSLGNCLSTSTHSTSSDSSGSSIEYRPYSQSELGYSDTDSKESMSSRTVAPGSLNFHKGLS